MTGPAPRKDDVALAGEYALHLLDARERRAFEARLATEPALRALVREWDERLVTLADEIAPVTPPAHMKRALRQRLFADEFRPAARRWSWLRFGGGALAGLALVLALLVLLPPSRLAPPGPAYLAEISAEDGSLVVRAALAPDAATLTLERVAGDAAPGRALEVWLIAGGAAPVSLGVLPQDRVAAIALPDDVRAALAGGTLAISDEPPGGSPTGQPTGAVLAVGQVTTL